MQVIGSIRIDADNIQEILEDFLNEKGLLEEFKLGKLKTSKRFHDEIWSKTFPDEEFETTIDTRYDEEIVRVKINLPQTYHNNTMAEFMPEDYISIWKGVEGEWLSIFEID